MEGLTDPAYLNSLPRATLNSELMTEQEARRTLRYLYYDARNKRVGGNVRNKRIIPPKTLEAVLGYRHPYLKRVADGVWPISQDFLRKASPWLRAIDAGKLTCKVTRGTGGKGGWHYELIYELDSQVLGQGVRADIPGQQRGCTVPQVSRQTDAVGAGWYRHFQQIKGDR